MTKADVNIVSLLSGAESVGEGAAVVIDVFRAFTVAALALQSGAKRVVMTDSVDRARALCAAGIGAYCAGERGGVTPEGFDFGNSPVQIAETDFKGETLILTTSNGTAGLYAAARAGADPIYAGSLVTAGATVAALQRQSACRKITLVAMGRGHGTVRTDEDELCALLLRSRLAGRQPDTNALRRTVETLIPPTDPALIVAGYAHADDRVLALATDSVPFAVRVTQENGVLIGVAE